MPMVSKAEATQKNGKVKKGFREVVGKDGRSRFYHDAKRPDKKTKSTEAKKPAKKSVKKTVIINEEANQVDDK